MPKAATEYQVTLPTFHDGQTKIWQERSLRNVVRCGRRFGKTKMIVTLAGDAAIKSRKVGIFTPEYKQLQEPYDEILNMLSDVITGSNKSDGVIKTNVPGRGEGKIDFWRLIDNELAGRGREYDLVLIDEAAYTKDGQMIDIWNKSIVPTMATKPGAAVWAFSTPKGDDPENFFRKLCDDPSLGFKEFHAPSWSNPLVDENWLKAEKERLHPDVWRQEVLAEWVNWQGIAFFSLDKWLDASGAGVPYPKHCDRVFAVIDSAVKDGSQHDATAIIYAARNQYSGTPVVILDYETIQIEADLLNTWVPTVVLPRLDELAKICGAREGVRGVFVEDKVSGSVLLQHGNRKGWPLIAIDSGLTALGKDERAIAVSGHHHQGSCKISQFAHDKTVNYKGSTRNHLESQVTSFRLGDRNATKRADDLLDCYTYLLALSLGNARGY